MKNFISLMIGVGLSAASLNAVAAANNELKGSDTLFELTREVLSACPAASPLIYDGGGSSTGEQAMLDGDQEIAPMSRFLGNSRTCQASDPSAAEGLAVALDGLAIVEDGSNTQCGAQAGVAESGECFAVPGQSNYCFSDAFDALRILYTGQQSAGGSPDCDSPVRAALAANWAAFHAGSCSSGTCSAIAHAWRRDDLSGTTDTFLSLLDLPGIGSAPFCNGNGNQDDDPIRRPCAADDDVCSLDGTVGLVVNVFVPPGVADAYPTATCQAGSFGLAEAFSSVSGGTTQFDCPEAENFSIAGFCLAPRDAGGDFDCVSPANNPNIFFPSLSDDARVFNKYLREPGGSIVRDVENDPVINAWYRTRPACDEESSTNNIGCLVGEYDCTVGFAGRSAAQVAGSSSEALNVDGFQPSVADIQSGNYPLSRNLYVNSLVGFDNVTDSLENALLGCFENPAVLNPAIAAADFVQLPGGIELVDFDESACQ